MAPRSLLWPDPRVKPLFGAAAIDWGHPLSASLYLLILANEGAGPIHNLVTGRFPTATTQTWVSTPAGLATSNHGSTDNRFAAGATAISLADPVSVFGRGQFSGGTNNVLISQYLGDEGNSRFSLGNGGDGQFAFSVRADPGGLPFTAKDPAGYSTTKRIVNLGGTFDEADAAAGHRIYVNGKKTNTQTTTGVLTAAGGGTLRYGPNWSDAIFVVGVWGRALTDGEHFWLSKEPYAMLRPIIRRRYFVPLGPDTLIGDGAAVAMAQSGKGIGVYISEQRPRG